MTRRTETARERMERRYVTRFAVPALIAGITLYSYIEGITQ